MVSDDYAIMPPMKPPENTPLSARSKAIIEAILVTLLWTSSIILIKKYLLGVPALAFTGLRYALAFLFLLPGLVRRKDEIRQLRPADWRFLVILGLVYYTITQGAQFLTLMHLDAISMSLLMNFTGPVVALLGLVFLKEPVSRLQWLGMAVFLVGVAVYFFPIVTMPTSSLGVGLALLTMSANSTAAVMGRSLNRKQRIDPMVVTGISMGVGAAVLLGVGLALHGIPRFEPRVWLLLFLIGGLNTALAFWLWNRTQQVLTAMESSVINNAMLIHISVFSWIFLGQSLSLLGIIGLLISIAGVLLVSWKPASRKD